MEKTELTEFLATLENIENKLDKKAKVEERLGVLTLELEFVEKYALADDKKVEIYEPLVQKLIKENSLLFEMQNDELLEDIKELLELNQAYIRKTKEQFDEIESLRAKLAKQPQGSVKLNTSAASNAELKETKQKLQQRNKRVKELNDKVDWLQKKRKTSRELTKEEQKVLKLFNTPKKYFLDSKKWYVKPLGIFFSK
ncbi:hypothetical protein [Sulfurimonas microaerophilic]|uniref:hypothetical protein n=1 Tax=Sulfurimonas microaerophilic TaxID=3058392 RepID=UPI002714A482|nr:hypothetical protein [Sulfurimonas sp. hsl 1-7]